MDLSQELISDWSYEHFQSVAAWVLERKGHFGRIDVAMDDRSGVIDIERIYASVVAGNCVSHFRKSQLVAGLDLGSGVQTGQTICLGSRQSDTYLRIYDKAAEQRAKEKPVEGTWVRWEMEWKDERADAVGLALSVLDHERFQKYLVGVFRTAVDFRDCTRADDPERPLFRAVIGLVEGADGRHAAGEARDHEGREKNRRCEEMDGEKPLADVGIALCPSGSGRTLVSQHNH